MSALPLGVHTAQQEPPSLGVGTRLGLPPSGSMTKRSCAPPRSLAVSYAISRLSGDQRALVVHWPQSVTRRTPSVPRSVTNTALWPSVAASPWGTCWKAANATLPSGDQLAGEPK